jgi:hypothetical protein
VGLGGNQVIGVFLDVIGDIALWVASRRTPSLDYKNNLMRRDEYDGYWVYN